MSANRNRPMKNKIRREKIPNKQQIIRVLHTEERRKRVIKYYDTYLNAQNATTTIGYSNLTVIPQGVAQSQRIADTVWVDRIEIRFNITTANADIFSIMRWGLFVWKQNSNSVTPGATSIYESAATFGVLTPVNFEGREYYSMLLDRLENLVGIAAAPTPTSQIVGVKVLKMGGHRVDFEVSATTGSGHIYFVNFSDSAVIPHPVYTIEFRVWYFDE